MLCSKLKIAINQPKIFAGASSITGTDFLAALQPTLPNTAIIREGGTHPKRVSCSPLPSDAARNILFCQFFTHKPLPAMGRISPEIQGE